MKNTAVWAFGLTIFPTLLKAANDSKWDDMFSGIVDKDGKNLTAGRLRDKLLGMPLEDREPYLRRAYSFAVRWQATTTKTADCLKRMENMLIPFVKQFSHKEKDIETVQEIKRKVADLDDKIEFEQIEYRKNLSRLLKDIRMMLLSSKSGIVKATRMVAEYRAKTADLFQTVFRPKDENFVGLILEADKIVFPVVLAASQEYFSLYVKYRREKLDKAGFARGAELTQGLLDMHTNWANDLNLKGIRRGSNVGRGKDWPQLSYIVCRGVKPVRDPQGNILMRFPDNANIVAERAERLPSVDPHTR